MVSSKKLSELGFGSVKTLNPGARLEEVGTGARDTQGGHGQTCHPPLRLGKSWALTTDHRLTGHHWPQTPFPLPLQDHLLDNGAVSDFPPTQWLGAIVTDHRRCNPSECGIGKPFSSWRSSLPGFSTCVYQSPQASPCLFSHLHSSISSTSPSKLSLPSSPSLFSISS